MTQLTARDFRTLLCAVALFGCVTQSARSIERGMAGLPESAGVECLGPPDDFYYGDAGATVWISIVAHCSPSPSR